MRGVTHRGAALHHRNDSRFQARHTRCLGDRGRHALGAQRLGERPSIATGSRRSRASVRSSRSMFGRRSDRSLRGRARRGATVASYGCGRLRRVSSRGHWEGCEFPRGLPKRNGSPRRVDCGPTADRPRREARCPGQDTKILIKAHPDPAVSMKAVIQAMEAATPTVALSDRFIGCAHHQRADVE